MPVVRSVRAALYGGTPCPTAVRCQPRQQALRPADCAERKQVKCRDWGFSRLGGAHRLEEGVDVAYKVAEVSIGPRVLREELAANHLAAHTGGVAPVGVDPGGRQRRGLWGQLEV